MNNYSFRPLLSTGEKWIIDRIVSGKLKRIGIMTPTARDARVVANNILDMCTQDDKPVYSPSRQQLQWGNGARCYLYSATAIDRIKGMAHDGAWAYRFDAWENKGDCMLHLRLSMRPDTEQEIIVT